MIWNTMISLILLLIKDFHNTKVTLTEYRDEINTTLFVLNNFLKSQSIKTYKHLKINYQDWFDFCYNFTTIKQPERYEGVSTPYDD